MWRGVARRFGRYSSGWPAARVKAENISAKSHIRYVLVLMTASHRTMNDDM